VIILVSTGRFWDSTAINSRPCSGLIYEGQMSNDKHRVIECSPRRMMISTALLQRLGTLHTKQFLYTLIPTRSRIWVKDVSWVRN
jgi:hypothetical protein